MSKIVCTKLKTDPISQPIKFTKRSNVKVIRIHLLKCLNPDGVLSLKVKHDGIVLASSTLTSLEIEEKSELITDSNYAKGFISFEFPEVLSLNKGDYELELSASGYTYQATKYFAWISDFENIKNNIGTVTNFKALPYSFEVFAYEQGSIKF